MSKKNCPHESGTHETVEDNGDGTETKGYWCRECDQLVRTETKPK